jgi:tRNA A37 threonylcarbamoyladenosine biosynthesis protein TsaE
VPLVHVDAYRLSSAAEVDDLDLDLAGSITVVEWGAGKLDGAVDAWLELDIERPLGGDPEADDAPRRVRLVASGTRWMGVTV